MLRGGRHKKGGTYKKDSSKDAETQLEQDLNKFMKQHVYNLKSYQMEDSSARRPWTRMTLYLVHRMFRDMASLRTIWYLGCNLFSNYINMGTANNEIIKQALSDTGDYDAGTAVKAFFSVIGHIFAAASPIHMKGLLSKGSVYNDEKLFLISKRFNIREMDYNNFHMSRRLGILLSILSSDNLLLPYSTGDFIM